MTAPIVVDDLATAIGYYDQAVRKARDVLVDVGVLRIVGGGRGKVASYELLDLPGAGADPALPLLGRVPARTPQPPAGPTLFDDPACDVEEEAPEPAVADLRANNLGEKYRRWFATALGFVTNVGDFHRRCLGIVTNVGTFHRRWITRLANVGEKYRRWFANVGDFHRPLLPLDVDDARARDVHTFQERETPADARDGPPTDEGPPPPVAHPWHAWCGRVCVPNGLHQEFLQKGHAAPWLRAFYARRSAAIPAHEKITVNDYTFWRGALKAELASPVGAKARAPTRHEGNTGGWSCPHVPMCQRRHDCLALTLAEARAERERTG